MITLLAGLLMRFGRPYLNTTSSLRSCIAFKTLPVDTCAAKHPNKMKDTRRNLVFIDRKLAYSFGLTSASF